MAFLNSSERNWLTAGFLLLLIMLFVSSIVSYQNMNHLVESDKKSHSSYEAIKNLDEIFIEVTVAESSRRGYIYLGNHSERSRYEAATVRIQSELDQLNQQFEPGSKKFEKFKELEKMILQRVEVLQSSIALYETNHTALIQQGILTNRSIALRERIQSMISEITQEEQLQLKQALEGSKKSIQIRKVIELWFMIAGFIAIFICFAALYSQMTQRQQAEILQQKLAQQKEISHLKTRFFAMVSHEFRTPLSVILGSVQLLIKGNSEWNAERRMKNLDRIQSAAKSIEHLFTDVLMLTRADSGKLECNPEWLDLEAFCLNLVEDFEISTKRIIDFEAQDQVSHAYLDERLLYSILSNLLSNAMNYSSAESKVWLLLEGDLDRVRFQVRDQGVGIPLEDQTKLYEPFYRGQNSNFASGTGLGLAVVKRCVDLQQGLINIESKPGIGTTVIVEFDRQILSKYNHPNTTVRLP